jgi:transmembrane sensor
MSEERQLHPENPEAIEATAAAWLARRDRGFSADDEAEFALWRFSDARHAAAVARLEAAWGALDALRDYRPEAQAHPDPDLLGERRPGKVVCFRHGAAGVALAVAAALAIVVWWPSTSTVAPAPRHAIIHPGPERLTLEDGSVVELNAGAKVDVRFTSAARRVRLVRGEAHFIVAKDPSLPFVVAAGGVAVRAVGTAFSVALGQTNVAVLVTEGRVRVDAPPARVDTPNVSVPVARELVAGQRAVVITAPAEDGPAPGTVQVSDVTPAEVERALAWQGLRLEFVELPLAEVVAEFNRYNRQKLVVGDAATGALLVGGNFRADNVDAFVRLLESGFGVTAVRRGDEIVLRRIR